MTSHRAFTPAKAASDPYPQIAQLNISPRQLSYQERKEIIQRSGYRAPARAHRLFRPVPKMFSFPAIWPQRLELGVKMVKCVLCFVVAVTLLQSVGAQTFFACTGRECLAGCRPLDCDRGRVIQNATACGCCPICIKPLGE